MAITYLLQSGKDKYLAGTEYCKDRYCTFLLESGKDKYLHVTEW